MGNWRTVTIEGYIDMADVGAALAFVDIGKDWYDQPDDRFHCLCYTGPSLCGLGLWIPRAGGDIRAVGNLSERDYGVQAVADTLRELVALAPSLRLKVHCGGDYEDDQCIATVTVADGQVSVGDPEITTVGVGLGELGAMRLGAILAGWE